MRWVAFFFLVLLSSCREVLPVEQEENISGYQINCIVTNQGGAPIPNVYVFLFYDEQKISNTQQDTTVAVVTDTNQVVTVQVFSIKNILVRTLFKNKMTAGAIPRFSWDGLNDNGVKVPSGYYTVRYSIDTIVVKDSPVVVDGNLTAQTDAEGRFVITNENLPVGKTYDKYLQENFQGVFQIGSSVVLDLVSGNSVKTGRVYLKKDTATKVSITM